ncbi:hypothetical protein [Rhabdochromatium marinum]|uniref:hypothetical protein n=1 Tax=Rhabdochromatium marinum TaxID=48729 RepID=UPI0019087D67|nr:hypothetical protein [Rhabdochromatium marinum]
MKTDISIYDFLALGPEAFRILGGGRETKENSFAAHNHTARNNRSNPLFLGQDGADEWGQMMRAFRQIYDSLPPVIEIPPDLHRRHVEVVFLELEENEVTGVVASADWPAGLYERTAGAWQGELSASLRGSTSNVGRWSDVASGYQCLDCLSEGA